MFFDRIALERFMDLMENTAKQLTNHSVSVSLYPSVGENALVLNIYMSAGGSVHSRGELIPQHVLRSSKIAVEFLVDRAKCIVSNLIKEINKVDELIVDAPKTEVPNSSAYKSVW